jgi:hypothetical protein
MRRFWLTATMAVAMMATITLAQAEKQDSAHTLVTPNAPDPGRAGTVVQFRCGSHGGSVSTQAAAERVVRRKRAGVIQVSFPVVLPQHQRGNPAYALLSSPTSLNCRCDSGWGDHGANRRRGMGRRADPDQSLRNWPFWHFSTHKLIEQRNGKCSVPMRRAVDHTLCDQA